MPNNPFKVGDVVRFKNIPQNESCHRIAMATPGTYFKVNRVWGGSIRIAHMDGEPVGVGDDRANGGQPYFAWRFEREAFMKAVFEAIGETKPDV